MNQLIFPQIYCSAHPHYQLNLVCRQPNCAKKGAICCRCQLQNHSKGHTFDSFVPLDEVIFMAKETEQSDITPFSESVDQLIEINTNKARELQNLTEELKLNIYEQIRNDYIIIGSLFDQYKSVSQIVSAINLPGNDFETPTYDGEGMTKKELFLNMMKQMADKIKVDDGQYVLEKSDIQQTYNQIVNKRKTTLIQLEKMYDGIIKKTKQMLKLSQWGCNIGINHNIPLLQLKGWIIAFNEPSGHPTTQSDISNLKIPQNSLVCFGALKNNLLVLCSFDEYSNVFSKNQQEGWYLFEEESMGFSPESNIQLVNGCDIIKSDERLSWSLNGSGVFRYGNNMDAHEELDCRKVILFYQL